MPRLYRVLYEHIGDVSDEQLQQLVDALEEEDEEDDAYFIDGETITFLAGEGVDSAVVEMLRGVVGEEGAEIVWEADEETGEIADDAMR